MPLRFLDFPAEIREQVYGEVLSSANSKQEPNATDQPASYKFHLDILRVNHQIHREAKKSFQDNIFVKITTPWPEAIDHIRDEGKVPTVTTGKKAKKFCDFHLWVFIDTPISPLTYDQEFSMLICLEDLEAFTRMWHLSNLNHHRLNSHLRLKLTVQDPHVPDRKILKALQSKMLLPFGKIKDLHAFSIHGPKLLDSVQEILNTERNTPDPSPETCIENAIALKDQGNSLLKSGSYHAALDKYISAFGAIHISVVGRTRTIHAEGYYIRELQSGPYKDMRGDIARMVLRVQLVSNIVLTYSKMEEWAEAHFWGKRSIILFKQSVTGDESEDIGGRDDRQWLARIMAVRFPAQHAMGRIFYRVSTLLS